MEIVINPGSGPVSDATESAARAAVDHFVEDLRELHGIATAGVEPVRDEGDGRWSFNLTFADGRRVEVEMPGLPVERVRWMGGPDQNIWDFPRLYVDGSSWVWLFALRACSRRPAVNG